MKERCERERAWKIWHVEVHKRLQNKKRTGHKGHTLNTSPFCLISTDSSMNYSRITSISFRENLIRYLYHSQGNNQIISLQTRMSSELSNKMTRVWSWSFWFLAFWSYLMSLLFPCVPYTTCIFRCPSYCLSSCSPYTFPNTVHWCLSKLKLDKYLFSSSL